MPTNTEGVELLAPAGNFEKLETDIIAAIFDETGQSIPCAQPGSKVWISLQAECMSNDLIRKAGGIS